MYLRYPAGSPPVRLGYAPVRRGLGGYASFGDCPPGEPTADIVVEKSDNWRYKWSKVLFRNRDSSPEPGTTASFTDSRILSIPYIENWDEFRKRFRLALGNLTTFRSDGGKTVDRLFAEIEDNVWKGFESCLLDASLVKEFINTFVVIQFSKLPTGCWIIGRIVVHPSRVGPKPEA